MTGARRAKSGARIAGQADRLLRPIFAGEVLPFKGGWFSVRELAKRARGENATRALRFFQEHHAVFETICHPERGYHVRIAIERIADESVRADLKCALRKASEARDMVLANAGEAMLSGDVEKMRTFARLAAPHSWDAAASQLEQQSAAESFLKALDSEVEIAVPLKGRALVRPRAGLDALYQAFAELHEGNSDQESRS